MSRRLKLVTEMSNGRLFLALAVLAAGMVIQAILGASPALALSERPDDTYMTNGKIYATALSGDGDVLYIGGEFTRVGQKSGSSFTVKNVAAINVKTGAAIRTWRPEVTGHEAVVRALAVKNGKVYIGGNFTSVEGKPRKNLAAVGAYTKAVVLSPFSPQVGGDTSYVFALEAGDRKLYAGGGFSKVNGAPRKNLAAFSLKTGALDRRWKPKATKASTCKDPKCSHKVRALELTSTRTRLYGGFGARRNFLAAFRLDKGNSGARIWRFATLGNVQSVALTRDGSRLIF